MRTWNVVVLLLVAAFVVAPCVQAQSDDDLRNEVQQLKADLQKVIATNARIADENEALRNKVDGIAVDDNSLEARINALSEQLNYSAATTVNSVANPITFTGEFRSRGGWVFDRNFGAAGDYDDSGNFVDARFLVGMTFEFDRNVVTHLSIQANGLYGNGDTPAGSDDDLGNVDVYEAWIHLNDLFGRKEFSARTGRQEVVLGNEFQFGNNDFFSGETHDGTHWMWQSENFNLHFLWMKGALDSSTSSAFSTRNHPYVTAGNGYDDDELYTLYLTIKSLKDMEIDLYWIYVNGTAGDSVGTLGNGAIGGRDAFYHTFGARIGGMFNVAAGLDYNLEFAYQTGDMTAIGASDIDIDAFAIEVGARHHLQRQQQLPRLRPLPLRRGFGRCRRDRLPAALPERHAHAGSGGKQNYRARYGIMDIVPMTNVLTVQGGLHFDPRADWTIGLTVLWAEHDEDVFTGTTSDGLDDSIGFEIDVFAEYRYSDQTTLGFGLGVFFPDDGAPLANSNAAGNDDDIAVLIYTQVRVIF
ncbi:MAG: alginate export family protein [Planctomycetota bacterium]